MLSRRTFPGVGLYFRRLTHGHENGGNGATRRELGADGYDGSFTVTALTVSEISAALGLT